jgi:hypothetical protein
MPIAMISLLVFAYKSKIAKAYGYDCLSCKHLPNVCKFLLALEVQILDTAFSSGAERCRLKTFSILSILGFALRSTPSLHHHFIIHPVLLILWLINEKELFHLIIPVAFIPYLLIESLTYHDKLIKINIFQVVLVLVFFHKIHGKF